jgi:putative ABC transport system substrate-binding protein
MRKVAVPSILCAVMLLAVAVIAEAQQSKKVPRIGYLAPVFPCSGSVPSLEAFRQGLRDLGYVEDRNIIPECRSAGGKLDRQSDLARELVQLKVDVIVAAGGEPTARAAKQATQTIPIVMTNVGDPVVTGLVASLARPGGNVTGLVTMSPELSGKRLELLREAFPKISRVALFWNSANPEQEPQIKEINVAGQALGIQLQILEVRGANDFDKAFPAIAKERADAILTLPDPLSVSQGKRIADFAAKNRLPAMYPRMEFVDAGGLMAYGPNYNDLFRRAAVFVDKILKGAKPADLPVEQPTKFEFVINLKTAKQIGLTIPPNVLARADRVIK